MNSFQSQVSLDLIYIALMNFCLYMKVSGGNSQNNLTNLQSRTDLIQEVPNIF